MRETDLLIAPWGLPWSWRPAKYVFMGYEEESTTSLSCLAKALNPRRILIVISESALCSNKMINKFLESIQRDSYGEALDELKTAIVEYVRENSGVDIAGRAVRIAVCPAHGHFKPQEASIGCEWRSFLGNPVSDYASCVIAYTLEELAEINSRGEVNGKVEIALDITHGINYMPLAAFRAVMAAARILSASAGVRINVDVFNSEPYVPDQTLEIHLVDREAVTSVKAATRLVYTMARARDPTPVRITDKPTLERLGLGSDTANYVAKELGIAEAKKAWRQVYTMGKRASATLHYGLPLALLQYGYENAQPPGSSWLAYVTHKLVDIVSRSLESSVIIRTGVSWVRVLRLVGFDYDDVKAILASAALLDYACRAYLEYRGNIRISDYGALEVPVDTIRGLAEKYLPPAQQELVKSELTSPSTPLRRAGPEWTWLGEKGRRADTNTRNYIAHAGFERNLIEAKRENGETLLVRFCRDALAPRGRRKVRRLDQIHDELADRIASLVQGVEEAA
ncbi:hypothetical protein Pyrde_1340 [Pyrodictium delaneyi]|uniref:TIGR01897 family CRISPR-associated protein n=1 Tax=Pyrodictium delaneyi TaxID=1273541 RepID=A0A0P0N4L6_9CREN|nr:TM1812 family CRISPR-associated protein [Pyrodictium delaneyi]ALL01386.1 hypothetical protein Pyrde_1340 [Pyrodictium delaneyi]